MDNPHEFLGLKENASLSEIKKAYRLYASKLHPDKHSGDPFFDEMFKRVSEAYDTLCNPNARRRRTKSENNDDYLKQKVTELERDIERLERDKERLESDKIDLENKMAQLELDLSHSDFAYSITKKEKEEFREAFDRLQLNWIETKNELKESESAYRRLSNRGGCSKWIMAFLLILVFVLSMICFISIPSLMTK